MYYVVRVVFELSWVFGRLLYCNSVNARAYSILLYESAKAERRFELGASMGSQMLMKDARYTGKKNLAVHLQSGLHPSELLLQ
jgi:hypothetical protein